jgi:hypothetical protein
LDPEEPTYEQKLRQLMDKHPQRQPTAATASSVSSTDDEPDVDAPLLSAKPRGDARSKDKRDKKHRVKVVKKNKSKK